MRRSAVLLTLLLLAAGSFAKPQRKIHFDGKSWWEHVRVLADDAMEGRETGSVGLRKAQAYTVERLKEYGMQPAGSKGFYQPIDFFQRQIDEKDSFAALVHNEKEEPLTFGDDAYFVTRVEGSDTPISAPMVFAGYGLRIAEKGYDDFAALDLKGKIVVYLSGSSAEIPGPVASRYGDMAERWGALRAAGAVGLVTIPNPAAMDIPWSRMSLNRTRPSVVLADPEFQQTAGLKLAMMFNPARAEKLFAGSGHTFAEIAALGRDRKPLPRFSLAVSLKARASIQQSPLESSNVIAKFPGADPKLKDQYVVLTAHLDHLGSGQPIDGRTIYSGAMDDASGCAVLLDIAESLWRGGRGATKTPRQEKLRRSVLFVFFTAKEKGLLGSKYFTAHPTVSPDSLIANINVDMFLPIIPLKTMRIQGLHDSALGDRAAEIALSLGVKPVADPEPLRNLFIRSDQYNFILHGVPSVIMDDFAEPGTQQGHVLKDWLTTRYHAPSDDLSQPVDLHAAALYEEIARRLLIETAVTTSRPEWHRDSFFRRYASR